MCRASIEILKLKLLLIFCMPLTQVQTYFIGLKINIQNNIKILLSQWARVEKAVR